MAKKGKKKGALRKEAGPSAEAMVRSRAQSECRLESAAAFRAGMHGRVFALKEEMLALEAIYGAEFQRDADGVGFQLHVVPFPGGGGQNRVSCNMHIRCGTFLVRHSDSLSELCHDRSCMPAGMALATRIPLSS